MKTKLSSKSKDILMRSLHTFWEGALAAIVIYVPEIIQNSSEGWDVVKPMLISAGIGILAAGFSALKTGVIVPYLEEKKREKEAEQEEEAKENKGE